MKNKENITKAFVCGALLALSFSSLKSESHAQTMMMRRAGNAQRSKLQIVENGIENNTSTSEKVFMDKGQKQFVKIGIGLVDQDGDILNKQAVIELEPGSPKNPNQIDASNIKETTIVESNNVSDPEEQQQMTSVSGAVSLVQWSLEYDMSAHEKTTRTIKGGFSNSGYVEIFSEGLDSDYKF